MLLVTSFESLILLVFPDRLVNALFDRLSMESEIREESDKIKPR